MKKVGPDHMYDTYSEKKAAFLKSGSGIPNQSGSLVKKFPLCLCPGRAGKRPFFLPICIALAAFLWLACPMCLHASDNLNCLDYETAMQKGKTDPRPLVLFFTTPWCYQCTKMKRKVFKNEDIISQLNDQFYFVEVDISQQKKLKDNFQIYFTPTTLFLDVRGKPIKDVKGYILTDRFQKLLRYVSEGHYKTASFSDFEAN